MLRSTKGKGGVRGARYLMKPGDRIELLDDTRRKRGPAGYVSDSALQNDRPLFKKIGYDFFVYAVMCTRCINKDFRDDGDWVARYKHFSYLTVTLPSAPLPAPLSD